MSPHFPVQSTTFRRLTLEIQQLRSASTSFFSLLLFSRRRKTVTLVGFWSRSSPSKRICNKSCTPHRKGGPAYLADDTVGRMGHLSDCSQTPTFDSVNCLDKQKGLIISQSSCGGTGGFIVTRRN
jgi:hypothetical protein